MHVEDQVYVLKSEKYLLYFLIKSTFVKYEYWFRVKLYYLKKYCFVQIYWKTSLVLTTLTYLPTSIVTALSSVEFEKVLPIIKIYKTFTTLWVLLKEQARFYIKIFLLGLIESIHGQHPVLHQDNQGPENTYIAFKKL
jgi:AraC family transcriptional activator of pobA